MFLPRWRVRCVFACRYSIAYTPLSNRGVGYFGPVTNKDTFLIRRSGLVLQVLLLSFFPGLWPTERVRLCSAVPVALPLRVLCAPVRVTRSPQKNEGQRGFQSKDFVLSRPISRCSNLVPSFLYASEPANRKASQIRATLCPSLAAIVSSSFFRSERTLKVRRVSFFIRQNLST